MDGIKNSRLISQCRSAANRFDKSESKRRKSQAALKEGRWKDMDEMGRIAQRASLRGVDSQFIAEALGGIETRILERILGDSDLQPSRFLADGNRVRRTVGRIVVQSPSSLGTGFMVSPELMLTNNHVVFSPDSARGAIIQFDYQELEPGKIDRVQAYPLRPDRFFLTDAMLDFTLVAVEPVNEDGFDVRNRGWNQLIKQSGKAITNDRVNIIQHPNGRPQEISVRANKILGPPVDNFLHYSTDTQPGSSGSPVYNDEWQVAALHHAGVPILDNNGNVTGWRANEGVRISSIMSFIERVGNRLSAFQQQILATLQEIPPKVNELTDTNVGENSNGFMVTGDGIAKWSIPLNIAVDLGGLSQKAGASTHTIAPSNTPSTVVSSMHSDSMASAREILESFSDRVYYDEESDLIDQDSYFEGITTSGTKKAFYEKLNGLVTRTHSNEIRYRRAKNRFLYPWIDLHEKDTGERELRSVYSGNAFNALEVLAKDLEMERKMIGEEYDVLTEQQIVERLEVLASEDADTLESGGQRPFNCEHVVPQSWFGKKEPMKGDLHHLFTCESGCNSFRSNLAYVEFPTEAFREDCGRREDLNGRQGFEPNFNRGAVARATLYFLLRYPRLIGDENRELQPSDLKTLLRWHEQEPPSLWEKHRNAAIFEFQGNRNPLIDRPDWAKKIGFFQSGFG